jgi:hypothetical protein
MLINNGNNLAIEFITWQEARNNVMKHNPVLAGIIDEINPNQHFKLIKAKYLYGSHILAQGTLQLPTTNNQLLPITDNSIPAELKKHLTYASIPLAFLVNKASEVNVEINGRLIPLNMLHPGSVFGLFETLSTLINAAATTPIWNVYAGARTAFMFPRITDSVSHKRLRAELKIPVYPPKDPLEHCAIFSYINQYQSPEKRWYSEVIFFTADWINACKSDFAWIKLQDYLFKTGWGHVQFSIDDTAINMLWESLASAMEKRRLRPRPYLIDTVRHLIAIGTGGLPGFKPVSDNEEELPKSAIQDAYMNVYNLKEYLPLLMCPHTLRGNGRHIPVYYFLSFPTLLAGSPSKRGTPSTLMDLRDIQFIMQTLDRKLSDGVHPAVGSYVKDINFAYYHTEKDDLGEIAAGSQMPKDDPTLIADAKQFKKRIFPVSSPFVTGCIKVYIPAGA